MIYVNPDSGRKIECADLNQHVSDYQLKLRSICVRLEEISTDMLEHTGGESGRDFTNEEREYFDKVRECIAIINQ